MMPSYLDHVVVVTDTKFMPDRKDMLGFSARHIQEPLRYSGLVDKIDSLYFNDCENFDDALMSAVSRNPQIVIFSLQQLAFQHGRQPNPDIVRRITQSGIPTIMFWFDIPQDTVAKVMECYRHSATLHMFLGASPQSHKKMLLKGVNYIYAGNSYDESQFRLPNVERDILVGFQGSLHGTRQQWVGELSTIGVNVHTGNGWVSYEEYLRLLSRTKIELNFSTVPIREYNPQVISEKGRRQESLRWLMSRPITWTSKIARNPRELKYGLWAVRNMLAGIQKPRYQARGRVWEALWCSAFVLEETNPVTPLYFEPYVDYVPFDSPKDLADKVRYYLSHDDERDKVRLHGRATVERCYDAKKYWQRVFSTVRLLTCGDTKYYGNVWGRTVDT